MIELVLLLPGTGRYSTGRSSSCVLYFLDRLPCPNGTRGTQGSILLVVMRRGASRDTNKKMGTSTARMQLNAMRYYQAIVQMTILSTTSYRYSSERIEDAHHREYICVLVLFMLRSSEHSPPFIPARPFHSKMCRDDRRPESDFPIIM